MEKLSKKELYLLAKQHKGQMGGGPLSTLTKKQLIERMKGAGIWDTIKSIGSKVKDAIKSATNTVKQTLFFPPNKLPNSAEKVFNRYKDKNITALEIRREPVERIVQKVINFVTGGALDSAKNKLGYDDVFHLYMVVTIEGKQILIEKNERINISDSFNKNSNYEASSVSMNGPILFDTFLNTTREKMGDFKFFQYNSKTNNCQDFITGLLKSNGLGSAENFSFIKQDTEKLFQELPGWASVASQGLTDLGGKLSSILGKGKKRPARKVGKRRTKKRKN